MSFSFLQPSEFLTLPIFGIDISQSSIKIARLKKKSVGLVPHIIDEFEISETCELFSGSGEVSSCDEVRKGLLHLKKKYKIEFARISIPEEKTYVFRVLVPRDALNTIEDFVLFNLDQYVPLEPQDVLFDYKILEAPKGADKIPVVVTVIPRHIIEQYTSIVESCGIMIVSYEAETHAISRAVIERGNSNPYIIINVDTYVITISIVEEDLVQYTQTLNCDPQGQTRQLSEGTLAELRDTLKKVIIYWLTSQEQKESSKKLENVILTGEAIHSASLINFLESNLFVNATVGNTWKNCFDINAYIPEISKQESLKYTTCVGLCLSRLK